MPYIRCTSCNLALPSSASRSTRDRCPTCQGVLAPQPRAARTTKRPESSPQRGELTKHQGAVAAALSRVDRCAARGEYRVALGWLGTLEAIGKLPDAYRARQATWRRATRALTP